MGEIDFITAFARLLRDGNLRYAFAADAEAAARMIQLQESDLPAWRQVNPADVEFQAEVLLRKRLDLVKFLAPETCRKLGDKLWETFAAYGRNRWPEAALKNADAFLFCQDLKRQQPDMLAASEWNRLAFACSNQKATLHWVRLPLRGKKPRLGCQLFVRGKSDQWREFFLYLGL